VKKNRAVLKLFGKWMESYPILEKRHRKYSPSLYVEN
jgi:hypothetical protein